MGRPDWPQDMEPLWAETGGICCKLWISSETGLSKRGDEYPYKYVNTSTKPGGGHAMSVVGWGVQEVENFLPMTYPGKSTIEIPYWVIRNSYGAEWGFDGYFKLAMPDEYAGINVTIGLWKPPGVPDSSIPSCGIWPFDPYYKSSASKQEFNTRTTNSLPVYEMEPSSINYPHMYQIETPASKPIIVCCIVIALLLVCLLIFKIFYQTCTR